MDFTDLNGKMKLALFFKAFICSEMLTFKCSYLTTIFKSLAALLIFEEISNEYTISTNNTP